MMLSLAALELLEAAPRDVLDALTTVLVRPLQRLQVVVGYIVLGSTLILLHQHEAKGMQRINAANRACILRRATTSVARKLSN